MKILIPTDFSPISKKAVQYALQLAGNRPAELILFNNVHLEGPRHATGLKNMDELLAANAEENLRKLEKELLNSVHAKIKISHLVQKNDSMSRSVREAAKNIQADLIILGTKGATGLGEVLFGSNAAEVIEQAPCPVIAVPGDTLLKAPSKVLFASDFENTDITALQSLIDLVAPFYSSIALLHIVTWDKPYEPDFMNWFKEEIKKKISYFNLSYHKLEGDGEVLEKIEQFIKDQRVDMIAMSTHRKSLFEKLFHRSLTKRMAYHTHIPLIAFHINEKERILNEKRHTEEMKK